MLLPIEERMRQDWNERARSDAYYYVAFGRRNQEKAEFLSTAALVLQVLQSNFERIKTACPADSRRALEIGCGPGRLMRPLASSFGEIHGVDVSDEMIALARETLAGAPGAHVHRNSGSDLELFQSSYFDFVYSFAVFQHIPSVDVVTRYLLEAVRVLKPGGVLCCQLRGWAPAANPADPDPTWNGCVYDVDRVLKITRQAGLHLLQITGVNTQYMWVMARKPFAGRGVRFDSPAIRAITPTGNPEGIFSPAGPGAAMICWTENFPEFSSLEGMSIAMGEMPATPCYISEHLGGGAFQLNALIPLETALGTFPVRVSLDGSPVKCEHSITIEKYPDPQPDIAGITDGVDLLERYSSTTGSLKVQMTGVADPGSVVFRLGSVPVNEVAHLCYDPFAFAWEFTLTLPPELKGSVQPLTITASKKWERTVEIMYR